jgi:hypothetical protein
LSYLVFNKIENYFIFEMPKKKIWANFQRIIELFAKKIVTKLSKIWVWDPGSRKNLFPDPGVKKALDPGSATLLPAQTDTQRRTPACLCQNTRAKKPVPKAF